jgi:hypothetical protein
MHFFTSLYCRTTIYIAHGFLTTTVCYVLQHVSKTFTSHLLLCYIIMSDRHHFLQHFQVYVRESIVDLQTIMLGKN